MRLTKRIAPGNTSGLALALAVLASAAASEIYLPYVESDLDGDGVVEGFRIIANDEGLVDLRLEVDGRKVMLSENVAWIGGIGQEPELTLAPNGSVRLTSMNDAIGRSRWSQTLTIAYRQGAYRVAGYPYQWRDTLVLEDNGLCDLNLLNGRGVLTVDGTSRQVRTTQAAIPVAEWKFETPIPAVCGIEP